jgi:integrase
MNSLANRFKFTKRELEALPIPELGKRADYYDTEVPKLQIRVTGNGKKSFYVRSHNSGTDRVFIGPFPDMTVEQARKLALAVSSSLAHGENPHEEKKRTRRELTFGELLDAYIDQHAKQKCVAWQEMQSVFRRYLSDWRGRKLNEIRRSDVQVRLNEIGANNGHVAANHTLTYARAAINWCKENELTHKENPWAGAKKFKTQARERFLKPDEMARFFEAVEKLNVDARDYILVSLYTGARRSNVLSMRWEEIDFTLGTWRIPRTKSGDSQTVPLTQRVIEILEQRKETSDSPWVFPGKGGTGHLVEPKKAWKKLLELSGLGDLRLHDLRRTLGSYMAIGNQSLQVIGKALGHKSATATQIYSRLTHDPIRQAVEKAQTDMLNAARAQQQPSADEQATARQRP